MKRLTHAVLTKLGICAPRCDKARIQPPRFGAVYLYIEQCRLTSGHRGDHQPGLPEPVGTSPRMPRTDMLAEWPRGNPDPAEADMNGR